MSDLSNRDSAVVTIVNGNDLPNAAILNTPETVELSDRLNVYVTMENRDVVMAAYQSQDEHTTLGDKVVIEVRPLVSTTIQQLADGVDPYYSAVTKNEANGIFETYESGEFIEFTQAFRDNIENGRIGNVPINFTLQMANTDNPLPLTLKIALPNAITGIFSLRDFTIQDENGNLRVIHEDAFDSTDNYKEALTYITVLDTVL